MPRGIVRSSVRVGLVLVTLVAATLFGAGPASAHSDYICSYMPAGAGNEVMQGGVLKLDNSGHNHDISWVFYDESCPTSYPEGAELEVAVRFLVPTSTGCTTTPRYDTAWKRYDLSDGYPAYGGHVLATNVLPGTCYRLIWRATNFDAMFASFRGMLLASDS